MSIEKFLSNIVVDGTISKVGGTSSQILTANGSLLTEGPGITISGGLISASSAGASDVTYSETPTGLVNSSNVTYTLANTPTNSAAVIVILDGVTQYNGVDYTVSGSTITFITAPVTGTSIFAYYNVSAGGGGAGITLTTVEVNLGTVLRNSGMFSITTTGLTASKAVAISQAVGPYTGKGTLADETEMDILTVTGITTSTTNINCYWNCTTFVKGNYKFNYVVST
jgi:hypothetical protein